MCFDVSMPIRLTCSTGGPLSEICNDLILAHRCRRGPSTPTGRMRLWPSSTQVGRDPRPEMNDPAPDRFVGADNPPFGQQILDVAEAQREAIIEPDRALDDFRREAVASVTDFAHSGRLRARARTQQGARRENAVHFDP